MAITLLVMGLPDRRSIRNLRIYSRLPKRLNPRIHTGLSRKAALPRVLSSSMVAYEGILNG